MSRPILSIYNSTSGLGDFKIGIISTNPGNDDQPIIKVETDAQSASGQQAQTEKEGRKDDANNSSNNEAMSDTAMMLLLGRSRSRHGVNLFSFGDNRRREELLMLVDRK
jgi:hypothetical protein